MLFISSFTSCNEKSHKKKIKMEYFKNFRGLSDRVGNQIHEAGLNDIQTLMSYSKDSPKGMFLNGRCIAILSEKTTYTVDEEVRIIHVFETINKEEELLINGPKQVYGEFVNEKLSTKLSSVDDYPWLPFYDGKAIKGPGIDYNFEITKYQFKKLGTYNILWKVGNLESNAISITVK